MKKTETKKTKELRISMKRDSEIEAIVELMALEMNRSTIFEISLKHLYAYAINSKSLNRIFRSDIVTKINDGLTPIEIHQEIVNRQMKDKDKPLYKSSTSYYSETNDPSHTHPQLVDVENDVLP